MNTETKSTTQDKATRSRSAPKKEQLVALLSRREGATIVELTSATGLLPRSARAALTGLRKKGHEIVKSTRDGVSCYSLEDRSR